MKAFITGLPLGYFTLVFSKLKTLSKFEWTGQQNHKRNRLPFIFVFFFFRSTTLSMQTRPWTQFTTTQVCRCVQGVWKTLYLFLRMNVKLLQPFQSKNVVFKPFRRGVDGAATDLQNHRCWSVQALKKLKKRSLTLQIHHEIMQIKFRFDSVWKFGKSLPL